MALSLGAARRPFRFGVVAGADSSASWTELVQEAEQLGYSTLFLSDHLDLSGAHVSTMAAIPAISVAAALTSRLNVGTSVLNQDFRHPAVLAREAATIQLLSGGRLELGVGAGWAKEEYDWAGITFDADAVRVRRLREYLIVLRTLLHSVEPVSFDGEFFRLRGMPPMATAEVPPPPLMVGGRGRRVLAIAAEQADIVNLNFVGDPQARSADVEEALAPVVVHPRFGDLQVSMMIGSVIVSSLGRQQAIDERLAERASTGSTGLGKSRLPDDSPSVLVGTVDQIVDDLLDRRQRWGVSYYIVSYPDMRSLAPVIDALRDR